MLGSKARNCELFFCVVLIVVVDVSKRVAVKVVRNIARYRSGAKLEVERSKLNDGKFSLLFYSD
jgi:hypothetical protein